MKYRLKDVGLQWNLDRLTGGDFSRQLEANGKRIYFETLYMRHAVLWFGKTDGPLHALEITPDMLEPVEEDEE